MKRNGIRQLDKAGIGFAGVGIGLGVASNIVEKVGGNAGGIGTIASYTPVAANVVGGGILINMLQDLGNQVKTKKQRRRQ